MQSNSLSSMQKDALKEVCNIGAGNASTALGKLLGCKIEMSVPTIEIIPIENVAELSGNPEQEVAAILLNVSGEAPGTILYVFTPTSMELLLKLILDTNNIDNNQLDNIKKSALKEIANILSGAYLTAFNTVTNLNLNQSVPSFSYDMIGAILNTSLVVTNNDVDQALFLETQFHLTSNQLNGYFFFIPEQNSLTKILSAIGMDE